MVVRNQQEPVFVNLQKTRVQVLDKSGRQVYVEPYQKKLNGEVPHDGAVFEVRGEHYAQFVSNMGPLYPHPDPSPMEKPAVKPTPQTFPAPPVLVGVGTVDAGFEAAVTAAPVEVAKHRDATSEVEAAEKPAPPKELHIGDDDYGEGEPTEEPAAYVPPEEKPKAKRKVASRKTAKRKTTKKTAKRKTAKRKTSKKSTRKK
jgi:hypothetical protein